MGGQLSGRFELGCVPQHAIKARLEAFCEGTSVEKQERSLFDSQRHQIIRFTRDSSSLEVSQNIPHGLSVQAEFRRTELVGRFEPLFVAPTVHKLAPLKRMPISP